MMPKKVSPMDNIDGYSSSENEQEIQKTRKPVQIHVDYVAPEIPKKRTATQPKTNNLFDILPKPSTQNHRILGGDENSKIQVPKFKKLKQDVEEPREATTEAKKSYFGISQVIDESRPILGPQKPKKPIDFNPGLENPQSNQDYYYQEYDVYNEYTEPEVAANDGIVYKEISLKDQIGDSYELQKTRNVSQVKDDPFKNLPKLVNQGRGTGGRTLLSMAYEAKAKQAYLDEQKEHRKKIQKQVRQKYGF